MSSLVGTNIGVNIQYDYKQYSFDYKKPIKLFLVSLSNSNMTNIQ